MVLGYGVSDTAFDMLDVLVGFEGLRFAFVPGWHYTVTEEYDFVYVDFRSRYVEKNCCL